MPTYSYQCLECGNSFEEIRSINDNESVICSQCGCACERSFTPSTNFILKGNGFTTVNSKLKNSMLKKNSKYKDIMRERMNYGEGVSKVSDLSKVRN